MNISAALIGQLILVLMLVTGACSYYLGRRKTQTPVLAAVLGVVLAVIPPFALLYLLVLWFKKDVASASTAVRG
ncbi:hypothetical protein [Rheinheimera sp. 4Y26]|uniref:hypothetical protein n=1 Tax=Rheinheimera sp. 4Y26 TaxID=2977811 RepID=UPI0021B0B594|nr:hypothetical protein [Rheinheimera sp. 4Y26]MCT6699775.1 hypothetical protein [Rheinheimera sp. 4Y26]